MGVLYFDSLALHANVSLSSVLAAAKCITSSSNKETEPICFQETQLHFSGI